ncbi:MAG: sugar phosphate isomerase/epimerase family protein [Planctomycetota bacterium]
MQGRRDGKTLQRALMAAARLGVDGIELCARTMIRPKEMSATGLRQLRKMLDDLNLRVAAVRFQTRRGYDNPQDLQQRVDATKDAMRLAYQVGASVVINQIGPVPPKQDGEDGKSDYSEKGQAFRSVVSDLGRHGAREGAFLAAETGTESGSDLAAFLDFGEDGHVAVALNPGNLIVNRHSVVDATEALKRRVEVVCACDGVLDLAAGRGLTVPLGQGTADFPQLIGSLEDVPYRGYYTVGRSGMSIETSIAELADAASYLRSL